MMALDLGPIYLENQEGSKPVRCRTTFAGHDLSPLVWLLEAERVRNHFYLPRHAYFGRTAEDWV